MKRSILLLLFIFASICGFAQKSGNCLYHIKFYKWQWNYCKYTGYDTVPRYKKLTGEVIGDTVFYVSAYRAFPNPGLTIPFPIPDSFAVSDIPLTVTNSKGKKLEVEKFAIGFIDNAPHLDWIDGSVAGTAALKKLQHSFVNKNPNAVIWLEIKLKDVAKSITLADAPIRPLISVPEKSAVK